MTTPIQERLRKVSGEIRRKPYPLKDFIPLLQEAADVIDSLYKYIEDTPEQGICGYDY
jgi:hypothetical protein